MVTSNGDGHSTGHVHLESIDDYLGPSATRFFGAGHRRVEYRLDDIVIGRTADGAGLARAVAGVRYPADWSRKAAGVTLRPHLSTIDALLFSAQLTELYLTQRYGLSAEQRRSAWLRRVDIKAGGQPLEDGLHAFPVDATLNASTASAYSLCGMVSTVDCRVGPMKLRLTVDHAPGEQGTQTGGYANADALLGPAADRVYGSAFKARRQQLTGVDLDLGQLRAQALATISMTDGAAPAGDAWTAFTGLGEAPDQGLEGRFQPGLSLVDAFVMSLQLGQVLLYELDGVDRAASNTLWMRRTTIEAASPYRSCAQPFPVAASLQEPRRLVARDRDWRTADIVSVIRHIRTRCSVAHELPQSVATALEPAIPALPVLPTGQPEAQAAPLVSG